MVAKIYRPAKTAMQSGTAKTRQWILDYEPGEPRRIEPLMGYTGSGDMTSQLRLRFDTLEDAIAYAEREAIPYRVLPDHTPKRRQMAYSDNFKAGRIEPWTH